METTNEIVAPLHYNPNQLVTYKVIDSDAAEQTTSWPTVKVVDLEWELEQGRRKSKRLNEYVEKVGHVLNYAIFLDSIQPRKLNSKQLQQSQEQLPSHFQMLLILISMMLI